MEPSSFFRIDRFFRVTLSRPSPPVAASWAGAIGQSRRRETGAEERGARCKVARDDGEGDGRRRAPDGRRAGHDRHHRARRWNGG